MWDFLNLSMLASIYYWKKKIIHQKSIFTFINEYGWERVVFSVKWYFRFNKKNYKNKVNEKYKNFFFFSGLNKASYIQRLTIIHLRKV